MKRIKKASSQRRIEDFQKPKSNEKRFAEDMRARGTMVFFEKTGSRKRK